MSNNKSVNVNPVLLSGYFISPIVLALMDLVFYTSVPLLLFAVFDSSPSAVMSLLGFLKDLFSISIEQSIALSLFSILVFRVLVTWSVENIFSRSIAYHYAALTYKILECLFVATSANRKIEDSFVRKILNAELNNLFFGYFVPLAFCIAEIFLILVIIIYAASVLGSGLFFIAFICSLILFMILYLLRKRSRYLGEMRSKFEEQRLDLVEMTLNNAFSIALNRGADHVKKYINSISESYASALGRQVVLPYTTKSIMDGVLLFVVLIYLLVSKPQGMLADYAVLLGLLVRVVPSLSRLSSYFETLRINSVAKKAINLVLADGIDQGDLELKHDHFLQFLDALPDRGCCVVRGASGIGKTTTLKHWLVKQSTMNIALLEQAGFVKGASLNDYLHFVGVDVLHLDSVEKELTAFGTKGQRLKELSGGQAKFIQFYALSKKPSDIYVFDEPSVGLDNKLKSRMVEILANISEKAKVIVVSHDAEFIIQIQARMSVDVFDVK